MFLVILLLSTPSSLTTGFTFIILKEEKVDDKKRNKYFMSFKELERKVRRLPKARQIIIRLGLKKKGGVLKTREIKRATGLSGKSLGGILAAFSQDSSQLLTQLNEETWALNRKYRKDLQKIFAELDQYSF